MKEHSGFLAAFEQHLKEILMENDALGECYLHAAYSACAFKAIGMTPRLLLGRFGISGSGVSIPHGWVSVDGYLFDASGKLNVDLLWDDGDMAEYSPRCDESAPSDGFAACFAGRSVADYLYESPDPDLAFMGLVSFAGMLGIELSHGKAVSLAESVLFESAL